MHYEERFRALARELQYLRSQYYNEGASPVPDPTYDALEQEFMKLLQEQPELRLLPEAKLVAQIGAPVPSAMPRVKFPRPLLSLDNAFSEREFAKLSRRLERTVGSAELCLEYKWDGVSVALRYQRGQLVQAATRGDGAEGEDVTASVKVLGCVPKKIDTPVRELWVRGELLFSLSKFNQFNQTLRKRGERTFTSPRNAVAGALRLRDTSEVAWYPLVLTCYDVIHYDGGTSLAAKTQAELLQLLVKVGLPVIHPPRVVQLRSVWSEITALWDLRVHLDVPVDGIVVKLNSIQDRALLGESPRAPLWAVAVKFTSETATTTLRKVEVQVGRTGVLTPVAVFDPVQLSGAMIERATLYNFGFVEGMGLRIGDEIEVIRSGEVIPRIIRVVKHNNGPLVQRPRCCPSCGTATQRGDLFVWCPNTRCPAQVIERLSHFVSTDALDIRDCGPQSIKKLVTEGLVCNPADLYFLTEEQLCEVLGDVIGTKVYRAIEDSKVQPLQRLVFGLGIESVGAQSARRVAEFAKDLQGLLRLFDDPSLVLEIPRLNEPTREGLLAFFENERNRGLIMKFVEVGVCSVSARTTSASSSPLAGERVVFTGSLSIPRREAEELVRRAGGEIANTVSRNVGLVVAGANAGSKLEKARRLNVKVINEQEFLKLVGAEGIRND